MARGSRKPKKHVRGGAASKRPPDAKKRATPARAEAAPLHLSIEALVKSLRTPAGREVALASIIQRTRGGDLTRDEVSALTLEKHCVLGIGTLREKQELPERIADLEAQIADLQQAVAGKKGSALRADAAVVPPSLNEVTDPVGTDVASSTPLPRSGEPYQS
jgi:hypothetical protein